MKLEIIDDKETPAPFRLITYSKKLKRKCIIIQVHVLKSENEVVIFEIKEGNEFVEVIIEVKDLVTRKMRKGKRTVDTSEIPVYSKWQK